MLNFDRFVVLIEEGNPCSVVNFVEDSHECVQLGRILDVFAEQSVVLAPLSDDVSIDGSRLSQTVLSVDEVRNVGEVEAEIHLVLLEPFLLVVLGVMDILKLDPVISQQ